MFGAVLHWRRPFSLNSKGHLLSALYAKQSNIKEERDKVLY